MVLNQFQSEAARRDPRRQEAGWIDASLADPLSAQPWQSLAELDFEKLMSGGVTEQARAPFEVALPMMLTRRPRSSTTYRMAGGWMLRIFARTQDPQDAARVIEYFERAVELYPNSALTHADYALALRELGKPNLARSEAAAALSLDAAMPHADKRLPAELREKLASVEPAP